MEIKATVAFGKADVLLLVCSSAWRRMAPSFWFRLVFFAIFAGSREPASAVLVGGVLRTARRFNVWLVSNAAWMEGESIATWLIDRAIGWRVASKPLTWTDFHLRRSWVCASTVAK